MRDLGLAATLIIALFACCHDVSAQLPPARPDAPPRGEPGASPGRAQPQQPTTPPVPPTTPPVPPTTQPVPPTTPPVPPTTPTAPPAVPPETLPLTPSGFDALGPPRTDFLTRLLSALDPDEQLPGWYVIPALSLGGTYDDNIFRRSSDKQADVLLRISPSLVLTYSSDRFRVAGAYRTDLQFFADHSELNDLTGHEFRLELSYLATPLLRVAADVSYLFDEGTLRVPEETGVVAVNVGRQQNSSTVRASSSVEYSFSPLTTGGLGYTFTRSDVDGVGVTEGHSVELRASRELSALERGTFIYEIGFFDSQSETDPANTSTFHSLRLGYARELSPTTSLGVDLGPRFSEGEIGLDANFALTYGFERGSASLSYSRGQTVVAGIAGPRTADTLNASVGIELIESLRLTLSASASRISDEGEEDQTETLVYGGGVSLSYPLARRTTASLTYQFVQEDNREKITSHVITLGIQFAVPIRVY